MKRKRCSKCNKSRLVKFFYKRSNVGDGLKAQCSFCSINYSKKWKKTNGGKEFWKQWNMNRRLKLYGLTKEQYALLLKKQKGKCALCKAKLKNKKITHVDHDHKTRKVRGILCTGCNSVLGFAKDSTRTRRRAINDLIKN